MLHQTPEVILEEDSGTLPPPHRPQGVLVIFGFLAKTADFRTTVAPPGNSLEPYLSLNSNPIFSDSVVLSVNVTFVSTFWCQALG